MKNKKSTSSSDLLNSIFEEIVQLLHWKLNFKQLIALRNIIISKSQYGWKKNTYLGKALIYHYNKSNLNRTDNIAYHHLLMAELIRNFSIANKGEYLQKCNEFRVYPFIEKSIKLSQKSSENNLSVNEVISKLKKAFSNMKDEINVENINEIKNAINQEYPICSFDDLMPKSRLN
jgi:hypothetical protein